MSKLSRLMAALIACTLMLVAGCGGSPAAPKHPVSSTSGHSFGGSVHPPGWGSTPKGYRAPPQAFGGGPTAEMYDTVTLDTVPANPFALAGYTAGNWPTYFGLRARWPNAHTISIAVQAYYHADCLDDEPGDATPDQAGPWAVADIQAGFPKPCVYADLSEMPAVQASLADALGPNWRSRVFLWLAWYRFFPGLVSGYDAVQWTDSAFGLNLDESTVTLDFLSIAQPPYHPAPPGPSPAQVRRWIAARGSSLHAYYVHGCRSPVLTTSGCGMLAWRVDHFQKLVDTAHGYYPHCFGPRRNLQAAECRIVRPAVATWSRASVSSNRWHNYRVARYFDRRIEHTLATSRL